MRIEEREQLIREYYKMPADIQDLTQRANYDLYAGPVCDDPEYPGFCAATDEMAKWFAQQPQQVWVDTDCGEVLDREPEGYEDEETGEWVDPDWEFFTYFDVKDVKRVLFGRELASYI